MELLIMLQAAVQKNEHSSSSDDKELVVLIAEDNKGIRVLMRRSMEQAGISNRIIHFENGEELLDFLYGRVEAGDIAERTYALILDIHMPKVNGIEVLTSIRQDSNLRGIPVIANSSCDDQKTISLCHSLGCIDYIVKPINADDIIVALKRIGLTLSLS
jgi:CheY-like chemotaxis protein